MKRKSIDKRRIRKQCWSLDYYFIEWLADRLPVYLKDASTMIDLSFHKFTYKGIEYTQEELTRKLSILCNGFIHGEMDMIDDPEMYEDIYNIWTMIGPYTWW